MWIYLMLINGYSSNLNIGKFVLFLLFLFLQTKSNFYILFEQTLYNFSIKSNFK